ncbi:MAG: tRNA (N6-isopentenyl adenosine(37)-C2)-methylthiotransferase MiaB [Oscillospiraceae bacterium]|nr:tRNA (N6-isopentenyl adenosine(37)-C2)-methylthiotransferase MiaB [Oscillospiraceae bacterium]
MEQKTTVISEAALARQQSFLALIRQYWQSRGVTPAAFVDTYGCQQNEADSERIRGMLAQAGYGFLPSAEGAELVVINTCAIREHAEQRVLGNVGALVHVKRRHPEQKIFLCGCMMGEPHVVERIRTSYRHVDGVFSPHHLWAFPEQLYGILSGGARSFVTEDVPGSIAEGIAQLRDNPKKAWVSVMYGCNNFCSYCIVPYVRGRERSRRPEDILAEVRALISGGCRDITLLGQNVNSYGKGLDAPIDFSDLLAQVAELPGDFLVRFMTSHPKDATRKLFDVMASHEKIAKHIHLPFQSGNDRVLAAMNRGYTAAQYRALVDYARSVMPDLVLTSDVIVGFPGETTAEFEDTLKLMEAVRYDALFTFLFSPRSGTPAATMPDPVSKEEKQQNFDRLVARQNEISAALRRQDVGKTLRCLIDGRDGELLTARTAGGRLVRLPGEDALIGEYCSIFITDANTWSLLGTVAE